MRYDDELIKVENLKHILSLFTPVIYHPDDPRYQNHWRSLRKRCIEGIWVEQFGKFRYVPGRLGFFGVFGRFEDWSENKERIWAIPRVRDLEWHRAYYRLEMDGFSGWSEDDNYTSDLAIFEITKHNKMHLPEKRYLNLFKKNGGYKEFIPPRENIFMLHDKDLGVPLFHNQASNMIELGSRGGGKALINSALLYYDGYESPISAAKTGDRIYDHNGELTTITGVYPQGKVTTYKIKFRSGREIVCCKDHLWEVRAWNRKRTVKRTEELLSDYKIARKGTRSNVEYKYTVRMNKCLQYSKKKFIVDPYIIGCLLGDGHVKEHFHSAGSSKVATIITANKDAQHYLDYFAENGDFETRVSPKAGTANSTIYLHHGKSGKKRMASGTHIFQKLSFEGLNCLAHIKRIPEKYFYGDCSQRLKLLQGLMDTDGWVDQKSTSSLIRYGSSSMGLTKDVQRLARSLGYSVSDITVKKTSHRDFYTISIYSDDSQIFSLKRKVELVQLKKTNYSKSKVDWDRIVDISYYGEEEATCITVDNEDKLFLTDDFIVTHNSFSIALMQILPDLCFDGRKYYDAGDLRKTVAVIEASSGGGGKSTELLDKVEKGMEALADPENRDLGVWGNPGDDDFEPCPFFKRMTGSIKANNKETPWINEFPVKRGDSWKIHGTSSRVYNTVYTPNQRAGAQKSAGGRRTFVVHEEIGLNEVLLSAWGSNEGMIKDGGTKMAGQIGIGTSGNMQTILGAKKIFTHPREFSCLVFKYSHRPDEELGWFLATWMVDTKFKDENGNTDEQAAKAYHQEEYNKAKASLPEVYAEHRMNFPMEIEDMWIQNQGHYLPVLEAEERIKELSIGNLYEKIGTPIKLFHDSKVPGGINYIPDTEAQPFYEFPFEPDRKTREAVFTMYIHPDKLKIHGQIPNDAVIVTLDPYIAEDIDAGGSIGVSHFIVNPKYIPFGLPGNCLAATLMGKGYSTSEFHETLAMGIQFYGDPVRGLWYEADRGDKVRSDMLKLKKASVLCARPQFEQGQYMFVKNPTQTGYIVGGALQKVTLLTGLSDWLKQKTTLTIDGQTEEKMNIERFPCIFTLRQIAQYNIKGNFDAVSSLQAVSLAIGEMEFRTLRKNNNTNIFGATNSKLKKYARAAL